MIVMRMAGNALGQPQPEDGQYLKSMDFEAHDGRGHVITTSDLSEAMQFPNFQDAVTFWKTAPECHPVRLTDGKPNRPLTAYTWEFHSPDAL